MPRVSGFVLHWSPVDPRWEGQLGGIVWPKLGRSIAATFDNRVDRIDEFRRIKYVKAHGE